MSKGTPSKGGRGAKSGGKRSKQTQRTTDHTSANCLDFDKACRKCGKAGHLASACRSSGTAQPKAKGGGKQGKEGKSASTVKRVAIVVGMAHVFPVSQEHAKSAARTPPCSVQLEAIEIVYHQSLCFHGTRIRQLSQGTLVHQTCLSIFCYEVHSSCNLFRAFLKDNNTVDLPNVVCVTASHCQFQVILGSRFFKAASLYTRLNVNRR